MLFVLFTFIINNIIHIFQIILCFSYNVHVWKPKLEKLQLITVWLLQKLQLITVWRQQADLSFYIFSGSSGIVQMCFIVYFYNGFVYILYNRSVLTLWVFP